MAESIGDFDLLFALITLREAEELISGEEEPKVDSRLRPMPCHRWCYNASPLRDRLRASVASTGSTSVGRTDCEDRSENEAPGGAKTYRCLERLRPDEVGCVMLWSEFLKAAPITHVGKYADYDLKIYHWLKIQGQRLLLDWTCEAEHLRAV